MTGGTAGSAALLALALALAPLSAFGLRWGTDLGDRLARQGDPGNTGGEEVPGLRLLGVMVTNMIGNIATLPATLPLGLLSGEEMGAWAWAGITLGGGTLVLAGPT